MLSNCRLPSKHYMRVVETTITRGSARSSARSQLRRQAGPAVSPRRGTWRRQTGLYRLARRTILDTVEASSGGERRRLRYFGEVLLEEDPGHEFLPGSDADLAMRSSGCILPRYCFGGRSTHVVQVRRAVFSAFGGVVQAARWQPVGWVRAGVIGLKRGLSSRHRE
jgi:hypothetical protein